MLLGTCPLMALSTWSLCDAAELTCTALDARARACPSFQRGLRALLAVAYEVPRTPGFRLVGPEVSAVEIVSVRSGLTALMHAHGEETREVSRVRGR